MRCSFAPFGPLTGLTYGNGLLLAKTYTQDYRIDALTVQDPTTLAYVLNRTHAFTDGINLTGITDSRTAPGGTPAAAVNSYSYPSTNNKLASIAQGATTVRSFAYDGAGNITADTRGSTAYNYRYNKRNRLDQLTIGSTITANYTYDGLERLAIRTTQNMSPAGTTHYLYDLAGHLLVEADNTGQTLREYIWLDDMPLAAESDVNTGSPNLYFVHAGHLDTPLRMTDTSKTVVWDAYFLPFGEAQSITGTASNNLRFPGQYFLIEDGLHYNWYRHYDPTIERYTQPDPLALINGPNLYQYSEQNPVQNVDPDGRYVAPFPPIIDPLLRPFPPMPFMGPDFTNPIAPPEDKDPCAGLRKQLQAHQQKLQEYLLDPYKYDNQDRLGQGRDEIVISGRIRNLQRQIDNFRKQLEECEKNHGRQQLTCYPH